MRQVSLASALMSLMGLMSVAAAASLPPPPLELGMIVEKNGGPIESVVSTVLSQVRSLASDGKTVTQADIDNETRITDAQQSGVLIASLLGFDLNADGQVQREEIEIVLKHRRGHGMPDNNPDLEERESPKIMAADQNGDGVITISEMIAWARVQQHLFSPLPGRGSIVATLLKYDPNKDGQLQIAEAEALIRAAFAGIDTDGDGTLSSDERQAYDAATQNERLKLEEAATFERDVAQCKLLGSISSPLSMVAIESGSALSTTSLVGQSEQTGVASISVKPGEGPVALLLVSDSPVIWALSGATDRVERVLVGGAITSLGVSGIDPAKVRFLPLNGCSGTGYDSVVRFERGHPPSSPSASNPVQRLLETAGFKVVSVVRERRPTGFIAEPDGTIIAAPTSSAPGDVPIGLWTKFVQQWPNGVVDIDPATVRASAKVERYKLLPGFAGLMHLVQDGSLTSIAEGDRYSVFHVEKPLTQLPVYVGELYLLQPKNFHTPPIDRLRQICVLDQDSHRVLAGPQTCQARFEELQHP